MAETAGQTATEIKKVAERKRSKPQPDVEVETSSKKRPPPPPPAAAVKAIERAAVEGAKKGISEGIESSGPNIGTQAYIKAQEASTKAALEAADKANVAKDQAEAVVAKI